MAGNLFVTLCLLLVAAAAAQPAGILRKGRPGMKVTGWAVEKVTTETPYTKPTDIPPNMPESCSQRPDKNDYLMIVSPQTCTRFIVCDGFRETEMSCPDGLYFNYEKQYCDWPDVSGCDESKRPGVPTTEHITVTDVTGTLPTDVPGTPPPPSEEDDVTTYRVATA